MASFSNVQADLNEVNDLIPLIVPTKSLPLNADHQLMKTLTSLMILEAQDSLTPQQFSEHRMKTKQILESLIAKLENNYEYETYLESQIEALDIKYNILVAESEATRLNEQVS